jgi:hypothetical protein
MMTDTVKEILVKKMDEFILEVGVMADGDFMIGDATSVHFADAVELMWNAMGYSAKLEAGVIPMIELSEEDEDVEDEEKNFMDS